LDALYAGIMTKEVSWVLDADIRGYFDAMNHEWLVRFVEHRIADQRVTFYSVFVVPVLSAMEGAEPGPKVPLAALRTLEMIEETKKR
ncbi:MAG: hypothetical protein WCO26_09580, partial [Deltaproteobacteria bacterium]